MRCRAALCPPAGCKGVCSADLCCKSRLSRPQHSIGKWQGLCACQHLHEICMCQQFLNHDLHLRLGELAAGLKQDQVGSSLSSPQRRCKLYLNCCRQRAF